MSGQAFVGSGKRTFSQALHNLLASDYGLLGSRRILEMLVLDVQELVEEFYPPDERLRPGWMVFTGTKATGGKAYPGQEGGDHELVTIPWPVLLPEDVERLATMPPGKAGKRVRHELLLVRLVRLVEHGWHHPRGPVLLTQADLALLLGLTTVQVSQLLAQAREESGKPLLTKGYYFDQGMRPTHKAQVIALYETGVDEADIARRTHHAPQSVGRYIRDYERVKLLLERAVDPDEMAQLTNMQPAVVRAYLKLLRQHRPDLFRQDISCPIT
jgi:hypothetical protein